MTRRPPSPDLVNGFLQGAALLYFDGTPAGFAPDSLRWLMTGGRGHYLGMLGGALLLTAMQMLLAGTALPYAYRAVFFGLVILIAVIGLREKRSH